MAQEAHREAVLQELAKALAFDRTRVTLNGFTSLGLVELTRKRSRENLSQILCEPCPSCQGRSSENAADHLLRNPARNRPRSPPLRRAVLPHPRRAQRHRPLPRRRIAIAGDAHRLYRQTDFAGSRNCLHAGTVRYCVAVKTKGRLKTESGFSDDLWQNRQTIQTQYSFRRKCPPYPTEPTPKETQSSTEKQQKVV